ncbi:hypothetical protein [uncultured Ferrovibrio sp.]|jgi:hypothetical protein|uniref:hypothetical protein n=1 Tax=uncultured Ferrovibrio sp. TaxID=1576913 RepID=UPI002607772A|nr:hypothetical protein [uncultured Ferrovibrio sp.]
MFDASLSEFVGFLALAANIGIAVMIILLLGERSHVAWNRIRLQADELSALRDQIAHQAETSEQMIETMREEIADLKGQLQRAEADLEALQRRHREEDLPLGYTATLVDVVDRRYRTWRVLVRNPDLGADAGSFAHPAHRWIEGRLYEVPAPNLEYAIGAMQLRLPPREGFQIEPARERVEEPAEAVII